MFGPQTFTSWAGPKRTVKGKHARSQFFHGNPAIDTGEFGTKGQLVLADNIHINQTAAMLQGGLHRVADPSAQIGTDTDSVHHNFDIVLLILFQLR